MKRLKNVGELGGGDADAIVPYLELHRRAAPAGSDEHATAARRVVDRVTDEIAQYAAQQHRIARHRDARRDEAKPDPFEPCRFGELRFDLFEHRTEPDGLLTSAAGGLEQTESVDKLVELRLVARARTEADRRVVLLSISRKGAALVDELRQPIVELHKSQLGHLDARELADLSALLEKARAIPE